MCRGDVFPRKRGGGGVLFLFQRQLLEVVHCTVVAVAVDVSLDALEAASVGVLPEFPGSVIAQGVDLIMGYPIGIFAELGRSEIFCLEFVVGV